MKMMQREPTHPSLFLEEDYLKPLGLSHDKAAMLFRHRKSYIGNFRS